MLLMHQELANKEDPNGDENSGLVMAAVTKLSRSALGWRLLLKTFKMSSFFLKSCQQKYQYTKQVQTECI